MNIHPLGAKLFHVDGQRDRQTDMMKLIVDFCNSANTCLKNKSIKHASSDVLKAHTLCTDKIL